MIWIIKLNLTTKVGLLSEQIITDSTLEKVKWKKEISNMIVVLYQNKNKYLINDRYPIRKGRGNNYIFIMTNSKKFFSNFTQL